MNEWRKQACAYVCVCMYMEARMSESMTGGGGVITTLVAAE